MLTMQDALLALTRYWTDRGCMIVQPFNTEVGAGTLNPATVLRVLGPEPWRVAYVEPSVRPDDSRYGHNPNRLQTHTQFQVILKPDPGNPQELYLGSLAALGIDTAAHDVRFVEDNWASPAFGAWGLGWEVWLDGLEITQFTYFQQAGGQTLDTVSVEITYGVERILMALQGVRHFSEIAYAPGISYGEVFGQAEYEMSRYYLDDADIDTVRRLYADYAAEARRLIDARLPVPAHSYVLKCSHAFNILDSRGAVSTTERATSFAQMRGLSREVATLWRDRREELGHPLGAASPPPAAVPAAVTTRAEEPATLLFEIGTEELPAAEVTRTVEAVRAGLVERLAATRLTHGAVRVLGTPRRIVAIVDEVAPREPDVERVVRGPRVSAAYDAAGAPTKAAVGFARGQGADPAGLQVVTHRGVEHVALVRTEAGRDAARVLAGVLGELVVGLRAERNMRWNDPTLSFSRPVRWLLALLGETVVPVTVSTLAAGRTTRGHRRAGSPPLDVPSASGYPELLAARSILLDPVVRRELVVEEAAKLTADSGGHIDLVAEADVLTEVANLVEFPCPILGSFEERFLDLPAEILTTVMRKHQRYLPVRDAAGRLLPSFVAVADGKVDQALVRAGNEDVIRARFTDAAFFYDADITVPLETFRAELAKLTFEQRLGSVADRADRIAALARDLAEEIDLGEDDRATLDRAAALAKFDLATQMVIELSSLAGTMAREYARRAGEPEAVAVALFEMELPRRAGDQLPDTAPGGLLALADRLDLLVGLFALDAAPTGSSDPFGLRRAALGVAAILGSRPELAGLTVTGALARAARLTPVPVSAEALEAAETFVRGRYVQQLLDTGVDHRLVGAVGPLTGTPARAAATLVTLRQLVQGESAPAAGFAALAAALQRVRRIVPAGTPAVLDAQRLTEPAEIDLLEVVTALVRRLASSGADSAVTAETAAGAISLDELVVAAGDLPAAVDAFFDAVMVMADDPAVRAARLGLLAWIRDLTTGALDWEALGSLSASGR
ncbi:glycyl-tRNA synthetase, beta subunit [Frankia casuarinae]|uniref:Multifunctional fusion protein n=2 Tax=Frankia casuarinae (strain DSM 45818 / CECT 9043 / HFP020203 / CcI3) TaxID=106370 RepID=Q2JDI9_FRACC|nr:MULTISPECIES: glycine--tRNA ligase [Frankia]ABD10653.1 glycyl-tRNA synthetase beta chain [Frankia casuarinae]ETA02917.1 glycyl-tRNA synthetase, beta subunit [Frankia sp. CcI6]EYT93407.1 glycyl-tRNA synthetase, beta subunit [Frankia casuarinae]KDA43526.1 glycyl-tRNA synthetase, beta subunit [Frankia sp. BMG5.23]OHV55249.1 glycine--tRNA ligase subunit alpha/beta [Frankia sp. CgIS1]